MPEKETLERARKDKREGKAASTQAGEFVREEIEHVRAGKHGARSAAQAIAIGLEKAREAGIDVPPPRKRKASGAKSAKAHGKPKRKQAVSRRRSRATTQALKHEGRSAATRKALSTQAKKAARKRSAAVRSAAARKAVKTKGAAGRSAAARKAARTRKRNSQ